MVQLALRFPHDAPAPAADGSDAAGGAPGTATAPAMAMPRSLSPLQEMGAYEALWLEPGASFARLASRFRRDPEALPSRFVAPAAAAGAAQQVLAAMAAAGIERFGVRVHGAGEYPAGLRDARYPVELLYFQGWWSLVESPCVAVVGTRKPSADGLRSARDIAAGLAGDGWTIVSGLARGIDTAAHLAALAAPAAPPAPAAHPAPAASSAPAAHPVPAALPAHPAPPANTAGGRSIAVIGTPLTDAYPPENAALQKELAERFLLVSQVPVLHYGQCGWQERRRFFPERNATMSALTAATVIVEAGDTSGTLHQARAALRQGRKLLILESCFEIPGLSWPHRFERLGALRVRDVDDIRRELGPAHQG